MKKFLLGVCVVVALVAAAYALVNAFPAAVHAGMAEAERLVGRYRQALIVGGIGLAFILAVGALTAVLWWRFRRRQQAEAARAARFQALSRVTAALVASHDVSDLLDRLAESARHLIGAHQAVTSLTSGGDFSQAIQTVALSDKYAQWRDYEETPDGSGIYRLVCERGETMRMTQAELEAHPAWRGFGEARERHPPMRGWLAVPLTGENNVNLGLVQLSDKYEGEFTAEDEALLSQLAQVASVTIERVLTAQDRAAALEAAQAAREETETILTSISDAVYALDHDWRFTYLNAHAEELLEREREDLFGKNIWEEFPEARDTILYEEYHRAVAEQVTVAFDLYYPPLGRWFSVRGYPQERGLTVYFRDVSDQVKAEEQLRQAQKMEAVGQLTGGVAHDFNNLLTVILGNIDLLAQRGDLDETARTQTGLIQSAAERAAELTQRLLAFSRKQTLDPRAVDLNRLVADLEGLLRRTLGENIEIEFVRANGLWHAMVDAGQLENAIINLAINARDALEQGGKLTIETANTYVDDDYAESHTELRPGQYVMVSVADNGAGMSPETLERAIDPFFTTKPSERGTGLGLSMVYGFAKQSGGHLNIYSEPGKGTIVKLYLPRATKQAAGKRTLPAGQDVPIGEERILVVEDDELVRHHTENTLRALGYTVSAVETDAEAFEAAEREGPFDLLLTDVVLTGKRSGRDVAEILCERTPGLKVLFMSGYTENAIVHQGRLDPGVNLLGKPFRRRDIARKVRQVLDE